MDCHDAAIEHAIAGVMAKASGDGPLAERHVARARADGRATARRVRQIVEIASLVVTGERERAEGLAFEHLADFPDDDGLVSLLLDPPPARSQPCPNGAWAVRSTGSSCARPRR